MVTKLPSKSKKQCEVIENNNICSMYKNMFKKFACVLSVCQRVMDDYISDKEEHITLLKTMVLLLFPHFELNSFQVC